MPSKDKYTDPELRDQVKEEIHEGDKGGAPGQWSAGKAQMMASEYKKRGGGYTTDKKDKDESQKYLDKWTEEDWQTKEGSGNAKQKDGTEKRYLPKQAWKHMTDKEKEETDQKKQDESKEGKQYVANTPNAKKARKDASRGKNNSGEGNGTQEEPKDCTHHWENAAFMEQGNKEYKDFKKNEAKSQEAEPEASDEATESDGSKSQDEDKENQATTKKRGHGANQSGGNKKQKSSDSNDEPKDPAGDKTRVPKKGQKVQWKALPGFVDGEVVEIVYEHKTVEGKSVKGSNEDPQIVLKSSSSGKVAVHKPEAVYFD